MLEELRIRDLGVITDATLPLGPGLSPHHEIEKIGLGRYSHWKDMGILLSTSDNSDPNTNGRAYWAVLPPAMIVEETGSISYRTPRQ